MRAAEVMAPWARIRPVGGDEGDRTARRCRASRTRNSGVRQPVRVGGDEGDRTAKRCGASRTSNSGVRYSKVRVGGDEGDRTPDLSSAIAALSHLSYVPEIRATGKRPRRDFAHQGQAAGRLRRISASCATLATSAPWRSNISPRESPRPFCAEGLSVSNSSQSPTSAGR